MKPEIDREWVIGTEPSEHFERPLCEQFVIFVLIVSSIDINWLYTWSSQISFGTYSQVTLHWICSRTWIIRELIRIGIERHVAIIQTAVQVNMFAIFLVRKLHRHMVPVYAIILKYRSQLIVAIIMKEPIIQTWFAPKYASKISTKNKVTYIWGNSNFDQSLLKSFLYKWAIQTSHLVTSQ